MRKGTCSISLKVEETNGNEVAYTERLTTEPELEDVGLHHTITDVVAGALKAVCGSEAVEILAGAVQAFLMDDEDALFPEEGLAFYKAAQAYLDRCGSELRNRKE